MILTPQAWADRIKQSWKCANQVGNKNVLTTEATPEFPDIIVRTKGMRFGERYDCSDQRRCSSSDERGGAGFLVARVSASVETCRHCVQNSEGSQSSDRTREIARLPSAPEHRRLHLSVPVGPPSAVRTSGALLCVPALAGRKPSAQRGAGS